MTAHNRGHMQGQVSTTCILLPTDEYSDLKRPHTYIVDLSKELHKIPWFILSRSPVIPHCDLTFYRGTNYFEIN